MSFFHPNSQWANTAESTSGPSNTSGKPGNIWPIVLWCSPGARPAAYLQSYSPTLPSLRHPPINGEGATNVCWDRRRYRVVLQDPQTEFLNRTDCKKRHQLPPLIRWWINVCYNPAGSTPTIGYQPPNERADDHESHTAAYVSLYNPATGRAYRQARHRGSSTGGSI